MMDGEPLNLTPATPGMKRQLILSPDTPLGYEAKEMKVGDNSPQLKERSSSLNVSCERPLVMFGLRQPPPMIPPAPKIAKRTCSNRWSVRRRKT